MAAVMRGLDAEAYDRQYSDKALVKRISSYFRPYKRKVTIIVIATFFLALLGASLPVIISRGVDLMSDEANSWLISILIGVVFFTGVATWGANWVRRQLSTEVIADVILDMRSDAFDAAAHQDLSFYDEYSSGRIVSRITSDTEEFAQVITLALDVINQISVALILIVLLFTINVWLTVVVLSLAPVVTLVALGFRRIARRVTRQSSRALGEVNKSIQEAVTGISVAKNFRQEYFIYDEFMSVNKQ
ncbi:MAG: ABC transporter ATP-binding protein, partial [Anaerolineales bacterium]|nr:ABC transporter ATP-binding protein [Anaerolineales bacterium]